MSDFGLFLFFALVLFVGVHYTTNMNLMLILGGIAIKFMAVFNRVKMVGVDMKWALIVLDLKRENKILMEMQDGR